MVRIPVTEALNNDDYRIVTEWVSEDGQSSIPLSWWNMTAVEARAALLEQCASKADEAAILAGEFVCAE